MLDALRVLFASLSKSNAYDPRGGSDAPYRMPAPRPLCLACPPLEASGLHAYLQATDAQRERATAILVCPGCDRPCGVRI
jgi:hypothetical protein